MTMWAAPVGGFGGFGGGVLEDARLERDVEHVVVHAAPGFGVSGSEFRVSGFRFRVSGFRLRVSGIRFQVSGIRFQVSGFGYQASGFGYQLSGFGSRNSGAGFRHKNAAHTSGPRKQHASLPGFATPVLRATTLVSLLVRIFQVKSSTPARKRLKSTERDLSQQKKRLKST